MTERRGLVPPARAPGAVVAMVEGKVGHTPAPVAAWDEGGVEAGGAGGAEEMWRRVQENLREQPSLAGLADDLRIEGVSGGVVTLVASKPSQAKYARSRVDQIGEMFSRAESGSGMGRLRVEIRLANEAGGGAGVEKIGAIPGSVSQAEAAKNPLVRRAIELFGARVVDVRDEG